MPNSYVIFSSTREEIIPLIQNATEIEKDIYHIEEDGYVFITGIGPYSAHMSAIRALSFIPGKAYWLNIGICGSLSEQHEIGSWIKPNSVSILSWHPKLGYHSNKTITFSQGNLNLYTSPNPVREKIFNDGFVDMEAYPIAQIAHDNTIPCYVLKLVSDLCTPLSPHEIQERISVLSHMIAEKCIEWKTSLKI